ncbi:DUF1214 domain-containing protein [Mycolicibacter kumamotonensis]|uniref:DUF1214 domain-containing protein n=1 Tax=Mycolicibacter kumamotonensis TaxID=354243 RepID=A0A7K3L9E4_9MYCO|nr:DUF1214 domain-containing protein [Mycolicibacter kumamotonensis]NDJ88843.1 DUF1214 domain-containing protein [Mycolicibacter kumamotonensis]
MPRSRAAAATVTTSLAAAAMAMLMMAPRAVGESAPSQLLQPVIDQLLEAQQQITDTNTGFPFITPADLSTLGEYQQMLAGTMFASSLNMLARNEFHDVVMPWAPYPWSANVADPQPFLTYNNPDNFYSSLPVDPDKTYVITVHPAPGTQDVTFLANSGNGVTTDFEPLAAGVDLANATPNADGSYTIVLSSTAPTGVSAGNWVDIAGADTVVVRDTLGDWGQIHNSFSIEEQGASGALTFPLLSDDQILSMLGTIAANLPRENLSGSYLGQFQGVDTVPVNTFSDIAPTTEHIPGPLLSNQLTSLGHFSLAPDQALIVRVPQIDAAYSSIMVANAWGQTAPFATTFGSLNNTQTVHDSDGFTYYVISAKDPGVANWVDNSGITHGGVWLRWQNITGSVPSIPVRTEVVDVADVKNEIGNLLPADTPLVSAAERAADLQERLFEYGYAHDQSHGIAWVGANLMYDQVKAAMGAEQFTAIFGGQTDVPSVLDRLTPEFSPNLATLAHDILTNPDGSLSALINNVPLAIKDIELPVILLVERLQVLAGHTTEAIQTAVSSGDLPQLWTALDTAAQGLGSIFDLTLTDPATSITAGFLNARDDLAVAVMNAPGGFAPLSESTPLWDSLAALNEALIHTLAHSAAGTALLDPGDIAALDLLP